MFRDRLSQIRMQLNAVVVNSDIKSIIAAFEDLLVKLEAGSALTEERFEEQRKSILDAIHEIESKLKSSLVSEEHIQAFRMEIEKFKIKLELLSLHYKLKKISTQFKFEAKKEEFFEKMGDLKRRMNEKKGALKDSAEHFEDEITEAYLHLKKAFTGSHL